MLLVFRDDQYGDDGEEPDDEDVEWADRWMAAIQEALSKSAECRDEVLLDSGPSVRDWLVEQLDEIHQARSSGQTPRPGDSAIPVGISAQQYQSWEDWVMHQELHAPRRTRPRSQLEVETEVAGMVH